MSSMCNFSQGFYERGLEEGIEIGVEKGIGIGREEGIEIGVEKGIGIGVEKGIGIGVEIGRKEERVKTKIDSPQIAIASCNSFQKGNKSK